MNPNRSSRLLDSAARFIVEKELSHELVGGFFAVYNELGFGLTEPLYSRALELVLLGRGLRVDREYPTVVRFRGQQIGFQRVDMLVEGRVVVEVKATERLAVSARRQLRCYVAVLGLELGILLHFGPYPSFYRELGGQHRRR
jgi:GxxExxY protein